MQRVRSISIMVLSLVFLFTRAQNPIKVEVDSNYFVGGSLFLQSKFNKINSNPPDFYQLNFRHRLSSTEGISNVAKIGRYACPLGTPYGKSFQALEERFPRYIREYG